MTTPNFTELLASATRRGNQLRVTIPDSWLQGRTTYGGLTAAVCLDAAAAHADGRPVRAAQIAFVGPSAGELTATPTVLRRGRNTAFVSVQLTTEQGIAAEAIFVFGAPRESRLETNRLVAPEVPLPHECGRFLPPPGFEGRAGFAQNFEMRPASTGDSYMFGEKTDALNIWLRHGDGTQPVNPTNVLGLADGPPPAAAVQLSEPVPLSSMTWMAEFLVDDITTSDGWFLAHHVDEYAMNGYSSQAMTLFNTDLEPVMIGRQTVTIFG